MTKYFEHLHPVCIFLYFVLVIGMTLAKEATWYP